MFHIDYVMDDKNANIWLILFLQINVIFLIFFLFRQIIDDVNGLYLYFSSRDKDYRFVDDLSVNNSSGLTNSMAVPYYSSTPKTR